MRPAIKYREIMRIDAMIVSAMTNNLAVRRKGKYLRVLGFGSRILVVGCIVASLTKVSLAFISMPFFALSRRFSCPFSKIISGFVLGCGVDFVEVCG